MVEIDEARITQILVNIIGNAVKFTSVNGKVKVRARFVENDKDNMFVPNDYKKYDLGSDFLEDNEDEDEFEEKYYD